MAPVRGERSGQAAMNEGGSPSEEKIPNLSSFLPKICIFFFTRRARGSEERKTTVRGLQADAHRGTLPWRCD